MKIVVTIGLLLAGLPAISRTLVAGPGLPISTLRKAIELAKNEDTIFLKPGVYREGSLTLTKSIVLIGEGNPVLDGERKYEVLLISGKDIVIRGLYIKNSGYSALNDFAAIKLVNCARVTVENNRIENAYFAIHVSNSSYITIRNNLVTGTPRTEQLTGNGIHLWKSNHALIENNQVQGHRDGIYFEFVSNSMIRNNLSEKNIRYGLHFMFSNDDIYFSNRFRNNGAGVAVMYSKQVTMQGNHFELNWGASAYGLLLKDITDSHILFNTFFQNTIGIHMEGSSRITIEKNSFKENGWALKVQASCDNNSFHHNNFTGNSFDVGTNGSISLNNFYNNYWDKYDGYDLNKDGLGDVPYHPVSLYSMIVEETPATMMLFRSFAVQLLDKAEKAVPTLTPENLVDARPLMKPLAL